MQRRIGDETNPKAAEKLAFLHPACCARVIQDCKHLAKKQSIWRTGDIQGDVG